MPARVEDLPNGRSEIPARLRGRETGPFWGRKSQVVIRYRRITEHAASNVRPLERRGRGVTHMLKPIPRSPGGRVRPDGARTAEAILREMHQRCLWCARSKARLPALRGGSAVRNGQARSSAYRCCIGMGKPPLVVTKRPGYGQVQSGRRNLLPIFWDSGAPSHSYLEMIGKLLRVPSARPDS